MILFAFHPHSIPIQITNHHNTVFLARPVVIRLKMQNYSGQILMITWKNRIQRMLVCYSLLHRSVSSVFTLSLHLPSCFVTGLIQLLELQRLQLVIVSLCLFLFLTPVSHLPWPQANLNQEIVHWIELCIVWPIAIQSRITLSPCPCFFCNIIFDRVCYNSFDSAFHSSSH